MMALTFKTVGVTLSSGIVDILCAIASVSWLVHLQTVSFHRLQSVCTASRSFSSIYAPIG